MYRVNLPHTISSPFEIQYNLISGEKPAMPSSPQTTARWFRRGKFPSSLSSPHTAGPVSLWYGPCREQYPVLVMCRFFAVSRSGYYSFVKRRNRPQKDVALAETIRQQQDKCFHTYGYHDRISRTEG